MAQRSSAMTVPIIVANATTSARNATNRIGLTSVFPDKKSGPVASDRLATSMSEDFISEEKWRITTGRTASCSVTNRTKGGTRL